MQEHGLSADMPDSEVDEILQYYTDSVSVGLFSNNGGDGEIDSDLDVYGVGDQTKDGAGMPKIEDFWYFDALYGALDRFGRR